MRALRRLGVVLLFAAGLGGQALLQGPLGHSNGLRDVRRLHRVPGSVAFRLAAAGVREAAADALWLSVFPKLGRPWPDPKRKGVWIEAFTGVLIDANPRWLTPIQYASIFLEFVDRTNPAIERVLRKAMEAEGRDASGRLVKVNADSWELPELLGMHFFVRQEAYREKGTDRRAEALRWLKVAAEKPGCPLFTTECVGAILRRDAESRGVSSALEAWDVFRARIKDCRDPAWLGYLQRSADEERVSVLRRWAEKAEKGLGRWPGEMGEVVAEAPAEAKERMRREPDLLPDLVADVELHAETRDVEIPRLTRLLVEEGQEEVRELTKRFEAKEGFPPRTPEDLGALRGGHAPRPPRPGTKWLLSPSGKAPGVVADPEDPRLKKP